jgi:5'-methylthioadenosine phosphorylase
MTAIGQPVIGVIGGSGLYDLAGLENRRWVRVDTPFGAPSDELLHGTLDGQPLLFLPRHGRGHRLTPSDLNFRANVFALKAQGATELLSLSACGSLRESLPPGTFVFVDQFIDRTFARDKTFFGEGLVAHVGMGHPVCARLGAALADAAQQLELPHQRGGTYLAMEGPQFSTLAESQLYRSWGCDVIGMTNMPEAKLAREAELCYATVAMITDFDSWHPEHDAVTVGQVVATLQRNTERARTLLRTVLPSLRSRAAVCQHGCHTALDAALITPESSRDPAMVEKLGVLLDRALGRRGAAAATEGE